MESNFEHLEEEGYFNLREIPGKGVCGLYRFMFTVGLCVGIDETGYHGRYCFKDLMDARVALKDWDGIGDPIPLWIKYKGLDGERSNILNHE